MLLIKFSSTWNEENVITYSGQLKRKYKIYKIQPVFNLLYSKQEWDQRVPQNKHGSKRNYRRVGRKYLGYVDKLEKKGPIRGCKTEIAISSICKDTTFTPHQILNLKCLTFVVAVLKIFSPHFYNQFELHGEY